ncbi:adenine deaminase [Moorella naiadis]|uniref:adenine deaminase n=1 Tax=Moorella naiadis (nom. illeg.) TaxID=3093670 RepID=UPI003D9C85A4
MITQSVRQLKENLAVAAGEKSADLLLTNIQVVDVFTETIYPGTLVIKNGRIVAVNPGFQIKSIQIYDGGGSYAIPGFMDAHVHIEPTLLTPETLGALTVPCGTTALFVDAMEIANVAGIEGLRALTATSQALPYHLFLEVPSRVPTAPGLETTGGILGLAEVEALLDEPLAASLGEMDPAKVLNYQEEYLAKIIAAKKLWRRANGHAIGLNWEQLNVYACAGLADDHECTEYEELLERLKLGMVVMLREGSTERNVEKLIKGVIANNLPTTNLIFCTDDKHANDILAEGHINFNVNKAIALGLSPIKAIQMATINIARHFGLQQELGSLAPGRQADIILCDTLTAIKPRTVFFRGQLVAKEGQLVIDLPVGSYPEFLYHTVKVPESFNEVSLQLTAKGSTVRAKVINLYPDQIINYQTIDELPIVDDKVQVDTERDILKLAVVERYGRGGRVGLAFVRGFGLKKGALAASVAHDHHNIVVVGASDADMYLAVQEIGRLQGGLVAVTDGQVVASLPLPIGGLMSPWPPEQILAAMAKLNAAATALGCTLPAPFMTLSFISLPTVPQLGLTDYGLVDVMKRELVSPLVD